MLFDLGTGKKKRVVQAVYALLALLFVVGFVGFGVGSETGSGGIADIFTGGSDEVDQSQFAEDGDEIEDQLADDPNNEGLLVRLISTRFSAGQALLDFDEAGVPQMTEEAEGQFEKAADAWDRYLELNPAKPSTSAATFAVQTFTTLAQYPTSATEAEANWKAAADAQEVLAGRRKNLSTLSNLAIYSYFAFDFERGDRVSKQAVAMAPNEKARKRQEKLLANYRRQAQTYQTQLQQAERAENQGGGQGAPDVPENPLGDVAGGGGALSPAPTP